ncbi:50S ribosomal protein L30 [Candidatus Woesearchaeota archaeon]|nr:MAG: 50S ribosomal protein L30 [Candidatus Woesearchaeota archaeon]
MSDAKTKEAKPVKETKPESKEESKSEPKKAETKTKAKKLAIVRIRGETGIRKEIKDTLAMLRLYKKHTCVVYDVTPSIVGMIQKAKDFITWGEIDDKTLKELTSKRGVKDSKGDLKPFFRLAPPVGGFERKGIKKPFASGGVLGNRKEKINDLIAKMM